MNSGSSSRRTKTESAPAGKTSRTGASTDDQCQAWVRMYRHGLGDCFLIRLPKESGGTFNILIDCGLITVAGEPKDKMTKVALNISQTCNGHLDLVVLTHEHWDHVSGFSEQQARAIFHAMTISEVWYAWTEDPENELGRKLRRERESKLNALSKAVASLRNTGTPMAMARSERIAPLLKFFGLDNEPDIGATSEPIGRTRAAFDYLKNRREVRVRYCSPGGAPIAFDAVPKIRIYVLGPPEDEGMLKRSAPTKTGKEVYELASETSVARNLFAAFERWSSSNPPSHGNDCPFDGAFSRSSRGLTMPERCSDDLSHIYSSLWAPADQSWRQITDDWTAAAEALALNLDSHTNNTCLVLAIELMESGKVLLFPGDAQVGNWLSWKNVKWKLPKNGEAITGPELLQRTAFYKVGHHGSHNATLRGDGLELMTSDDLIAFVPINREEARKNRWFNMPFEPLIQRLREKTGGRLVLADQMLPPAGPELTDLTPGERKHFIAHLDADPDGLYYEYRFA